MSDPARPDPTTRDLLKEAYEAGRVLHHTAPRGTFDGWYAHKFPPPLPDEPPDGTVLCGTTGIWVRSDALTRDGYRWWVAPGDDPHTWEDALREGADPGRRLMEPEPSQILIDRGDLATVLAITHCAHSYRPQGTCTECAAVGALRAALAERGAHGG